MFDRWWLTVAALVPLTLTACGNPYRDTYESTIEHWPHGEASRLLPAEGEPRLVSSNDVRRDALRLMEEGYLLLGRSRFRGSAVDQGASLDQAKKVGASVVVIGSEYAESATECIPMTEWFPERQITTKETAIISRGPETGTVVERDVVRTIKGEFRTTCVPQTTDYYDYAATFWGKSRPPIFGVLVEALNDELRQQLQSNHGVQVQAVIRSSPAFAADILRGDIITSLAGESILDADHFFEIVEAHAGEQVTVEINRNGEAKTFQVPLETN